MKNKTYKTSHESGDYKAMSPAANPDYDYMKDIVQVIDLNNTKVIKNPSSMKVEKVSDKDYDGE